MIKNPRPARAHFRSRKLKWKDGDKTEETIDESLCSKILYSPMVVISLFVLALFILYYLYRKLLYRTKA
ncbi:unnamed protein product [Cylicocyclus nassatus]|uniref:Uncharacterized protein n=1 Tax=Cylicocyclus nassatus TaxID=53992 RepID=A0AA36GIV8_CYLNA|nr:unnamed protein product [Cylicocyclus nassatus]